MSAAPTRIDSDRRLLGVAASVDADALRRAYRLAVKQVHPDRIGGDGERLRAVIEAFRRLEAVAPAAVDVDGLRSKPSRRGWRSPQPRR